MNEITTNNTSTFKRRLRKVTFFFAKMFAVLLLILTIFSIWIYTGPRSIPFISKYISTTASELLPSTTVLEIEDVMLGFEDMNFTLKIVHPKVRDTIRGDFELTHVDLKLDLLGLLPQSSHNLLNIEISEPKLQLHKLLTKSENNSEEAINITTINQYLNKYKKQIGRFSLSLSNTSFALNVTDEETVDILINNLTISPNVKRDDILINVYGDINIGGKTNSIEGIIDTKNPEFLSINGTITNISSTLLKALGHPIRELENSHVEADVTFSTILKGFRNLESVKFEISNFEGKINKNYFFPVDIAPTGIIIKGEALSNFTTINFDQIKLSDSNLQLTSKMQFINSPLGKKISGEAEITNLKVSKIQDYWPTPVIARTREWIFEHISGGSVTKATAKFNINIDELIAKNSLKKGDLDVMINLAGASIFYLEGVPKITGIDGTININPDEIKFDIAKGKMLESNVKNVKGHIPDLGSSKSKIKVSANITGSIQNLIDIGYSHADIKNEKFKNIVGNAETAVKVSIPLDDRDLTLEIIELSVDAKAKDVSAKNIYQDYSISKGVFSASFSDMSVNINGTTTINESMPVDVTHHLNLKNNNQVTKIKANFNWDNLGKFNIKKPEFLNNAFDATLEIQEINGTTKELIDIDLLKSTVLFEPLGIKKKIGDPGRIRVNLDKKDWGYDINEYSVKIMDFESEGTSKLSSDHSSVLSISSTRTKLGRGVFGVNYENKSDTDVIQITGESLDIEQISPMGLSGRQSSESKDTAPKASKEKRGLIVNAKVNKLYMKNGIVLHNPQISVNCSKERCNSLTLKGVAQNGAPINLDYTYPNLVMNSDDAGALLAGLGIYDKMQSGKMFMSGKMLSDNKFIGDFVITDFSVKKAPILAKILSLASITMTSFEGIENVLGTKGVRFVKASCPFVYNGGLITIDECMAKGPTVAIVANGDINFNSNNINLDGTVVPENIINTAVKNIPLVNDLFGKKNKEDEVFGVSFKVQGPVDDPEVKANPLSLLTPGFLKKVFGTSSSKNKESNTKK